MEDDDELMESESEGDDQEDEFDVDSQFNFSEDHISKYELYLLSHLDHRQLIMTYYHNLYTTTTYQNTKCFTTVFKGIFLVFYQVCLSHYRYFSMFLGQIMIK